MKGKTKKPFVPEKTGSNPLGAGLKKFAVICEFRHNGEPVTKVVHITGHEGKTPGVTRRAILKRASTTIISKRILARYEIRSYDDLKAVDMRLEKGVPHGER
jgi:hypothetical protein